MNTWEKVGVGVAVAVVLGFIVWNYANEDISGSSAFTSMSGVTLHATAMTEHAHHALVIPGGERVLEVPWDFTVTSESGESGVVGLGGVIYTVHTEYPEAIKYGYLYNESGGGLWVKTPLVASGDRYILPFVFDQPLVIRDGETVRLNMQVDLGEVDEVRLPNDARYDISIDEPQDVLAAIVINGSTITRGVSVRLDKGDLPMYRYVFKTRPYVTLSPNSPSGDLIISPSTDVAVFDITADARGDVTFTHPLEPNYAGGNITARVDYYATGMSSERITTSLWSQEEGLLLHEKEMSVKFGSPGSVQFQIGVPRGEANELTIPAGKTRGVIVRMDTTEFNHTGSWVQWFMRPTVPEIIWSIEGDNGDYRHGDLILREILYAHKLTKVDRN